MNKKILLILIIIGFIIVVVLALVFGKKKEKKPTSDNLNSAGVITKIQENKMFFPKIINDKEILYYSTSENKVGFFKYNSETKENKLISIELDGPENVVWNNSGDKAILKVIYNEYIFEKRDSLYKRSGAKDNDSIYFTYNFTTKKLYPLPNHITSIIWLNNDEIIYNYEADESSHYIARANYDGTNYKSILKNNWFIPLLKNYQKNIILVLADKDAGEDSFTAIYELNIDTKQLKTLVVNSFDLMVSPSYKIAYLVDEGLEDFPLKIYGQEKNDLKINTTNYIWENNDSLIYFQEKENKMEIYRYNINDNKSILITDFEYNGQDEIANLSMSGTSLFFTSDDYLYKIDLKE